jgi:hypothetical protein
MTTRTVKSPDGLEWSVRVSRVRFPGWPNSKYEPADDGPIGYLVGAPLFWLVLPFLWVVVQLPVVVLRPLFSPIRWVEAESSWPSELKLIWKTRRGEAAALAEHVARTLPQGYEGLTPEGAALVYMSRPSGLVDLDR